MLSSSRVNKNQKETPGMNSFPCAVRESDPSSPAIDRDQHRTEEARKEHEEALQICRELAQKKPESYLPNVALTRINLGQLDGTRHRMEEARKAYQEALKTYRERGNYPG
jgi:tetratricopeptide (TPR) repeat protein